MKYDKENIKVYIDDVQIPQVSETKFLGVIIDCQLNWTFHIKYVVNKLNKMIGILYKARARLDTNILRTLYMTLIYPYLSYCITVWGKTYDTYIKKIFLVQKKLLRIITFSSYIAHSEPLFTSLKILNIYQIYKYFACMTVFKYYQCQLPCMFDKFFQISSTVHLYNTRNSSNLRLSYVRNKKYTFNIAVQGPLCWNSLSKSLKDTKNICTFKNKLRIYLVQNCK